MRRIVIALSMLLLAVACHEKAGPSDEVAHIAKTTPPASAGAALPSSSSPPGAVTIRRVDGSEVVAVRKSGETVEIRYGTTVLVGEPRDSGKRKYRSGAGPVIFEVKPGEGGFKLRTEKGELRWKVKITDDKIKISDNEENKNPFELKMKEGDRVKVMAPGERQLGAVRGATVEDANKKDVFRVDGTASAAYGVLLLDPIPADQRYILLAELLARGR
jgi:hypothetical protein